MRSSLDLQLALFKHQQRQIQKSVMTASRQFRAYESRYHRATSRISELVDLATVHERAGTADIVFVGDYHTFRGAQDAYLALCQSVLRQGRHPVLALELVAQKHQKSIDAFMAGRLTEERFLAAIGHPYRNAFDIWPNFRPLFAFARKHGLRVVAIDKREHGKDSLHKRDAAAAEVIAEAHRHDPHAVICVLMGQFHLAPAHLPREVARLVPNAAQLIVFQNAERLYWNLARRGLAGSVRAVRISESSFCLINASPVVCQRSFLDYVEAERGDQPVAAGAVLETMRIVARSIGSLAKVDVRKPLKGLKVFTAENLAGLKLLTARGPFSASERRYIREHVLSRESAYFPRARAIWLGKMSLNHAAEEASHFVRSVAVGAAMERARSPADAFWARCLEEAVGFFGSRLVNPARRHVSLSEWTRLFHSREPNQRNISAFVLALAAAHDEDETAVSKMLPLRDLEIFHAVSHALGYILGDALFHAFERGELSKAHVSTFFHDPFERPFAKWCEWNDLAASRPTGARTDSRRRASLRRAA